MSRPWNRSAQALGRNSDGSPGNRWKAQCAGKRAAMVVAIRGKSLLRAAVYSVKSLAESEDEEEISGGLRLERARGGV